ncbi:MAG: argininosuccinate lyase [Alkalispirochaeta sp.]
MAKLWDKGYELDAVVERFTVGRDFILDRDLIPADSVASIAHVRMLASVGIISERDAEQIESELRLIGVEGLQRGVSISRSDEDCHTVIEARLIDRLGDVGKMVHTGRSRNDQVTAATRLYTREALLDIFDATSSLVTVLVRRAGEEEATVMPGRTHLQIAMLSTFGLWLASWGEQLLDDLEFLKTAATLNDRNPLGSAASYGTPLPLDRELTAELLGFAQVQNNVLAVQHSRGVLDGRVVEAIAGISATLGRMAQDLIIFSLPEVGYVVLPEELCSGSSIMPQKRNPDVLELLRSRSGIVDGYAAQCRNVVRNLPSGYNRDLQDTKEPLLRALATVEESVVVATTLMERVSPDRERMRAALNSEVFATDYAYQLVEQGVPFREAYKRAAADYSRQELPDPESARLQRRSTGTPGALNLDSPKRRLVDQKRHWDAQRDRHAAAVRNLLGSSDRLRPFVEERHS